MDDEKILAARFEAERTHLRNVAYRMLGSLPEAEDAVQESWIRLSRSDASAVGNLGGWLTTVVARVCLDMLRSRKARSEEALAEANEPVATGPTADPEGEAQMADAVGLAVLVVLDALAPAERLAFVMHDMLGLPFEEIAPIVGRTLDATRQLASRARRRVQGAAASGDPDRKRQRAVVDAFLTALKGGDYDGLIAVLDPEVTVRAEGAGGDPSKVHEIFGAQNWARGAIAFARLVQGAQPALVNGMPGIVIAPRGKLWRALVFTITGDKISRAEVIAKPERVRALEVSVF
jgi:RNA polymerase sigma factor (sigma-70 family)